MEGEKPKKSGKIDQRVSPMVQKKLEILAQHTGWSESALISEMVLSLAEYFAGRRGEWFPFKLEFDQEAAEHLHKAREEQMAILREPDPDRRARMLTGMMAIPREYFQREPADPSVNEGGDGPDDQAGGEQAKRKKKR